MILQVFYLNKNPSLGKNFSIEILLVASSPPRCKISAGLMLLFCVVTTPDALGFVQHVAAA